MTDIQQSYQLLLVVVSRLGSGNESDEGTINQLLLHYPHTYWSLIEYCCVTLTMWIGVSCTGAKWYQQRQSNRRRQVMTLTASKQWPIKLDRSSTLLYAALVVMDKWWLVDGGKQKFHSHMDFFSLIQFLAKNKMWYFCLFSFHFKVVWRCSNNTLFLHEDILFLKRRN